LGRAGEPNAAALPIHPAPLRPRRISTSPGSARKALSVAKEH
jgi:hypothetical protein